MPTSPLTVTVLPTGGKVQLLERLKRLNVAAVRMVVLGDAQKRIELTYAL
jgi:hypothetical protein